MVAYYNEIDPHAAAWLRSLIAAGHLPAGDVDERSIADVQPNDLERYTQCHFFAGIGGWPYALDLARWPRGRPVWTGSCPCQPFSAAGKRGGTGDPRHLWPHFFRLIRACRPAVVMGEQVAGTAGYGWFDGVATDLEGEGYACRAVDIPACAVDAPHIRNRLYWIAVADAARQLLDRSRDAGAGRRAEPADGSRDHLADADSPRPQGRPLLPERADQCAAGPSSVGGSFWSSAEWLVGADGKSRRTQPGIRLLADGVPNRTSLLRGYGNAIVPQVAAEVIRAFMETEA